MDPFSYLSVLISIVLALGMTRLLRGIAEMLELRSRKRLYWVHLVWAEFLFNLLVANWWVFYRWRTETQWTFYLFVFVLLPPTVLYLCSVLLFPRIDASDTTVDYRAHFYRNHRAFFLLLFLFVPIDVADTLLKGWQHFLDLGYSYYIAMSVLAIGSLVAAFTRNATYHAAWAVVSLANQLVFTLAVFPTFG